jgi:hypothetical protein
MATGCVLQADTPKTISANTTNKERFMVWP